jgi:ribose-phosphate pyrophosphokinase
MLNLPIVAADKERISDTEVRISGLFGRQVRKFRKALVYDDEIATGGSVAEVGKELARNGIEEISAICTHGVFSGKAFQRLSEVSQIGELVTTDTLPQKPGKSPIKMTVLPVSHLFGEAIWRNQTRQSIGGLYTYWQETENA